jgi:hypothetical protein
MALRPAILQATEAPHLVPCKDQAPDRFSLVSRILDNIGSGLLPALEQPLPQPEARRYEPLNQLLSPGCQKPGSAR